MKIDLGLMFRGWWVRHEQLPLPEHVSGWPYTGAGISNVIDASLQDLEVEAWRLRDAELSYKPADPTAYVHMIRVVPEEGPIDNNCRLLNVKDVNDAFEVKS